MMAIIYMVHLQKIHLYVKNSKYAIAILMEFHEIPNQPL